MSKVFLFFILISFALCGDIKTTCEDDSTGICLNYTTTDDIAEVFKNIKNMLFL